MTIIFLSIALFISIFSIAIIDYYKQIDLASLKWHRKTGHYLFYIFLFIQILALSIIPICLIMGYFWDAIPKWYAYGGNNGSHGPWRNIPPLMNLMNLSLLLVLLSIPFAILASVLRFHLKVFIICIILVVGSWGIHMQMHWFID